MAEWLCNPLCPACIEGRGNGALRGARARRDGIHKTFVEHNPGPENPGSCPPEIGAKY